MNSAPSEMAFVYWWSPATDPDQSDVETGQVEGGKKRGIFRKHLSSGVKSEPFIGHVLNLLLSRASLSETGVRLEIQ
jgi:hypothetical protein